MTSEAAWDLHGGLNDVEGEYIVKRLNATYPIKFAVVTGAGSFALLKPMTCETIPCVTLVDEFAADKRRREQPADEMARKLGWSNKIAFSAETVASAFLKEYPSLVEQPVHILPQAQIETSTPDGAHRQSSDAERGQALKPDGDLECLVRLGEEAEHVMRQRRADLEIIQNDPAFDTIMFLEPGASEATRDEAVRLFWPVREIFPPAAILRQIFHCAVRVRAFIRKSTNSRMPANIDTKTVNPLAHFIRSGKPSGPWRTM